MAAVSSISSAKGLRASNRAEHDQWDFSIRPTTDNQQFGGGQAIEQYANGYAAQAPSSSNSDETARAMNNGTPKSPGAKEKADPNHLSPYKQGLKPDLVGGSRSGSEPDSLIDLYKQRNSMRDKSMDSPMPSPRHIGAVNEATNAQTENKDDDLEQSRWIHKDKLAEIERREMEAAGIAPPPVRSKSRSRPAQSPERVANGVLNQEGEPLPVKENKRRRVRSPPEPEQERPEEQIEDTSFDIRTPEEIAAEASTERTMSPVYRQQPGLRTSSSRIPLPRSSPMPLPQEHLERNTPLPRKRGASGNWDGEESIVYHKSRSRGNSVGSQVLLDDIDTPNHDIDGSRPPSSGSPTKFRTPPTSKHLRKTSNSTPTPTPAPSQKPRSTSGTQASTRSASGTTTRPKSRSGLEPRPPTAINRPEGDAPWLKDMYKPDPMLPPEQQLLPTHAKRLQEESRRREQWEQAQRDAEVRKKARKEDSQRSGGVGDATDQMRPLQREFSPLAAYTANGLEPTPGNSRDGGGGPSTEHQQDNRNSGSEWPLTRATGTKPLLESANSGGSHGTGDKIGNAGYSAMPRGRPGGNSNGASGGNGDGYRAMVTSPGAKSRDPFETEREKMAQGQGEGEKGKEGKRKKKEESGGGCCGCVVM